MCMLHVRVHVRVHVHVHVHVYVACARAVEGVE